MFPEKCIEYPALVFLELVRDVVSCVIMLAANNIPGRSGNAAKTMIDQNAKTVEITTAARSRGRLAVKRGTGKAQKNQRQPQTDLPKPL